MAAREDLLAAVQKRVLVAEGGMGTMLARLGVRVANTAEVNLTHPEIVALIHREYREAGAEVFQTNTFGANLPSLERAGLADRAAEIQAAAVRILRDAVGAEGWVGADLGPTGELIEPLGPDRVRFTQREHFTGLLVPLFARMSLYADTRRDFIATNEALKARAEAPSVA